MRLSCGTAYGWLSLAGSRHYDAQVKHRGVLLHEFLPSCDHVALHRAATFVPCQRYGASERGALNVLPSLYSAEHFGQYMLSWMPPNAVLGAVNATIETARLRVMDVEVAYSWVSKETPDRLLKGFPLNHVGRDHERRFVIAPY